MAVYPGALKTFPARAEQSIYYAAHVNVLAEEIAALQATLGTDPHVEPARAGGQATTFAHLSSRIANRAPSVVVEAEVTYRANTVLADVDVVWDSATTRRDATASTALRPGALALPAGFTYLVHLWAVGTTTAPTTARATLSADRTIANYRIGSGAPAIEGPEGFTFEQVALPVGQRPAGSRWQIKHVYSDFPLWVRPSLVDTSAVAPMLRTEKTLLAQVEITADPAQPYPLAITDIPLMPARATALRARINGLAPPGLRLVALSTDSPTVMP